MKDSSEIIKIAKSVIDIENRAISQLYDKIDYNFVDAIKLILESTGRLILCAIGKSANIANKVVATFNSTGQPAVFLHATDALHGDLGNIQNEDVVICISKSGNTKEIKVIVPLIKDMGNSIIAITGNMDSYLAMEAHIVLDTSVQKEACPYNLAPTSSTTTQLVMGDALAICLLKSKNFKEEDFARFHPGGTLGKRLSLKVSDILSERAPSVSPEANIKEVLIEISEKRLGATAIINGKKLIGIITDGDLRRMLEKENDMAKLQAKDIMSNNPKKINIDRLAYDALKQMEGSNVSQLIVMKDQCYVGIIHLHDIIKEGII